MRRLKAKVLTNSEDDAFMRVKLSCSALWEEESDLLSSLNSIPLEVNDIVLLSIDPQSPHTPLILGKLLDFDRESPVEGQTVFTAKNDKDWIIVTQAATGIILTSSKKFIMEGFYTDLKITTESEAVLFLEDKSFTYETPNKTKVIIADDDIQITLANGTKILAAGGNIEINSSTGKIAVKNTAASLFSIIDNLLLKFSTTVPTTQGSPAAQNFNPLIVAAIQEAKTKLNLLMQ